MPDAIQYALQRRNEVHVTLINKNKWELAAPVPVANFVLVDP